MRREVQRRNDDGTLGEVQRRTYDLKSGVQGQMIQVSIPADIPVKNYEYNSAVELVNPIADTVAEATYSGADVICILYATHCVINKISLYFSIM